MRSYANPDIPGFEKSIEPDSKLFTVIDIEEVILILAYYTLRHCQKLFVGY